jgi:LysM repeat protein
VCVSVVGHSPTTISATPTPTKAPNTIKTPTPTQPNIVDNCDEFYLVPKDQSCAAIASKYGITTAQFLAWNPSVGTTCNGLWADAYACVSIVGHTPTPANSVRTPAPIQTGMATNCKTFHYVLENQTCAVIAAKYGIGEANFIKWNPAVGTGCKGLWSMTYACVGLL